MTEDRKRQGRGDEVKAERRRRDGVTMQQSNRLPIPDEIAAKAKAEGLTLRWANDEGNRIHRLTVQDDYDRVDGVEPVPVGTTKDGQPIKAILLSKPDAFIAEDRAKADARRTATERAMARGEVPTEPGGQTAAVPGVGGATTYVDKNTSIGRTNQLD